MDVFAELEPYRGAELLEFEDEELPDDSNDCELVLRRLIPVDGTESSLLFGDPFLFFVKCLSCLSLCCFSLLYVCTTELN